MIIFIFVFYFIQGMYRNEAPVYRNTSSSRYVLVRTPVTQQTSGIVSHTDPATWSIIDDRTSTMQSFEKNCHYCVFEIYC